MLPVRACDRPFGNCLPALAYPRLDIERDSSELPWRFFQTLRLAGGFLDFGRRGEIGETLREVDGAVTKRPARHFTDDRFSEKSGLVGDVCRHRHASLCAD